MACGQLCRFKRLDVSHVTDTYLDIGAPDDPTPSASCSILREEDIELVWYSGGMSYLNPRSVFGDVENGAWQWDRAPPNGNPRWKAHVLPKRATLLVVKALERIDCL